MTGRIKMFNKDKGFGFILGDDGVDYFFHISSVNSFDDLTRGTYVSFLSEKGSKGMVAKKVIVTKSASNPGFISFDNTRIKLSNIKHYGISSTVRYYAKIYENKKVSSSFLGLIDVSHNEDVWTGEKILLLNARDYQDAYDIMFPVPAQNADGSTACVRFIMKNGEVEKTSEIRKRNKSDIIEVEEEYLYVTTYQKDNYQFFKDDVEFDIYDKFKEIDKYML